MQLVGSMGPPGGGRNPVTNRFLRHFAFVSFAEMADKSVARIFSSILSSFTAKYFPEAVQTAVPSVITATINIYNQIRAELLPTPSKSHYTFNLRDVAKVIQGLMRADPKTVTNEAGFLVLWLHESSRVFQDRLISDEDHAWFTAAQNTSLGELFGTTTSALVPGERLIFGDFMIPSAHQWLLRRSHQRHAWIHSHDRRTCAHSAEAMQMPTPRCTP